MDPAQCPACRGPVPEGARFCAACGSPMTETAGGDAMLDALQRSLEDRYRLLRLLGRGGMGAVYLARELSLERMVAIKVLHQDRALPAQAQERFRREARTVARLTHPNIVPLHGIGEVAGMPYLVMGYVAGESLGTRLQREGRLSVEQAVRILADVADALDYAHRQGVVHRDVKPENVLLDTESGRALLGDFGLAKAAGVDSTMTSGHVLGTPHYMSPEQAAGGVADLRSDIYSLGVTAYRMLSGRLPFSVDDVRDLLVKHIREAPPPLEDVAPGLPGPLVAAVHRCLAKNPVQRWTDMRAFRRAITGDLTADTAVVGAIAGQGPVVLAWAAACGALLGLLIAWSGADHAAMRDVEWAAAALPWTIALAAVASYGSSMGRALDRARAVGFKWREIASTLFRQPRWWTGPYPARLRWPGDMWPRLPRVVKVIRTIMQLPMVVLAVGIPLSLVASRPSAPEGSGLRVAAATALMFLVSLLVTVTGAFSLRRGLGALCWLATMDPERWRDPAVVRRLRSQSAATPTAVLTTPGQHVEAMARLAAEISGPARALAEDAAFVGRRVAAAVAGLDRQAAEIGRHADRDELERLQHRLELLGPASSGESAAAAELRQLLGRQLDLLWPMEERLQAGQAARERLGQLLAALHNQLALVRHALEDEPDLWREPAARLEDLCREAAALTRNTPADEALATRTR